MNELRKKEEEKKEELRKKEDKKKEEQKSDVMTLDRPKFEMPSGQNLGAVDIKFNHLGNRLAVSTIDNALKIYNLHPDDGLIHYKDLHRSDSYDIGKFDFNPNGNEILTGSLSLKTYDIQTGEITKEFNKGSKLINSVGYAPNGLLSACGTIDGTVSLFDMRTFETKKVFVDHARSVRALKFT